MTPEPTRNDRVRYTIAALLAVAILAWLLWLGGQTRACRADGGAYVRDGMGPNYVCVRKAHR